MNVSSIFFIVLLVMFLGILFFNLAQRSNAKETHRCPKCDSTDVIEVDHQTVDSRTVIPSGGGSPAGGDVRLQLEMKLFMRCKQCGNGFETKTTRTY